MTHTQVYTRDVQIWPQQQPKCVQHQKILLLAMQISGFQTTARKQSELSSAKVFFIGLLTVHKVQLSSINHFKPESESYFRSVRRDFGCLINWPIACTSISFRDPFWSCSHLLIKHYQCFTLGLPCQCVFIKR